jgi:hypothetical protein
MSISAPAGKQVAESSSAGRARRLVPQVVEWFIAADRARAQGDDLTADHCLDMAEETADLLDELLNELVATAGQHAPNSRPARPRRVGSWEAW